MSMSPVLSSYLSDHQVRYDILEHTHTSNSLATADAAHVAPEKVAKAVIVKHNNHYTMCVLPASHQLILEWLEYEQQLSYQLADEEELQQLFPDCELGAIPCIGQAFGMDVILDTALMEKKDIYLEGGDHQHLVHIDRSNFKAVMTDAWQAVISCPAHDDFEDVMHSIRHIEKGKGEMDHFELIRANRMRNEWCEQSLVLSITCTLVTCKYSRVASWEGLFVQGNCP